MAVGSHHGGGFHTGSHHSGGGSHSGGFSSGGGYDGGYGGGSSIGSDARLFVLPIYLTVLFIQKIISGEVPGINAISLIITIAGYVIFFFSLKHYDRTFMLTAVKTGSRRIYGQVWKGSDPPQKSKNGNNRSWVDKYGFYRIAFFDQDYGEQNAKTVYEMMKRTPGIIWMSLFVWLVIALVATFSTFFFYELIIPFFENMTMTDEAFKIVDEIVFYAPSGVTFLSAVTSLIVVKVRDVLLYRCAEGIVKDNLAADKRLKTEEEIQTELNRKWYYNVCPNCGAAASNALRNCTSCGSSLEVMGHFRGYDSSMHQISVKEAKGEEKA